MFTLSTVKYAVLEDLSCISVRRMGMGLRRAGFASAMGLMLLVSSVQTAAAQGGGRLQNDSLRNRDRKPPTAQEAEERRKFVAQFEQRLEQILFDRIQANDEQRMKMRVLKRRLDVDREVLFREEGEFRKSMATELKSATPNESRLAELLDKWPALQRRRIEIQEREQRELGKILSPLQRARFFAFDDDLRRARQDMQWGRGGRGGPQSGMPGMRADSTGGRSNFRGPGGRGGKPPGRDTLEVIKK